MTESLADQLHRIYGRKSSNGAANGNDITKEDPHKLLMESWGIHPNTLNPDGTIYQSGTTKETSSKEIPEGIVVSYEERESNRFNVKQLLAPVIHVRKKKGRR